MTQDPHRAATIGQRYCGPPTSGNGGYTCGLVAGSLEGPVEVTLLKPPPLEVRLRIAPDGQGIGLFDGETLVASALRSTLEIQPPSPPRFEDAEVLARNYVGFTEHAFPTCFVCGPERDEGDGLRIFPAKLSPDGPAVAPWVPHASVCDDDDRARSEIVWAALDCPGYFGSAERAEAAVLGRMTALVLRRPRGGEPCVAMGWSMGREGRKLQAATALYGSTGDLLALSKQTWIRLEA